MSTFHPREARYGRRELIRRGAVGAVLLSSAGTLLSACGGDDTGGSSAVDLQLARPDNPVTHPLFDDNADDRVRPRAGERHAPDLQLERLPLAEDQEGLREGVRRQGRGDVLLHDGRGDREDLLGRGRLRRVLPVRRPSEPARGREAAPALEPRVPPEPHEPLDLDPGSLVRQGLALHGAVHGLHDRDRVPDGQGLDDPARLRQPVRDVLGGGGAREDVPPRRLPRRVGAHASEERDHGHQHRGSRRHRRSPRRSSSRSATRST